jgi:hypothetical protein
MSAKMPEEPGIFVFSRFLQCTYIVKMLSKRDILIIARLYKRLVIIEFFLYHILHDHLRRF